MNVRWRKYGLSVFFITCIPDITWSCSAEDCLYQSSKSTSKTNSPLHKKESREDNTIDLSFKRMVDNEDYVFCSGYEFELTVNETIYLIETMIKRMGQSKTKKVAKTTFRNNIAIWLEKLENVVMKKSSLQEKIQLLELYEMPEIQTKNIHFDIARVLNKHALLTDIKKSNTYSLEENLLIANYFYRAKVMDLAEQWLNKAIKHPLKSFTIAEKLLLAQWLYAGYGVILCDVRKAREIFIDILMHGDDYTKALCIRWIERIERQTSPMH
jgi:hypothetical protein